MKVCPGALVGRSVARGARTDWAGCAGALGSFRELVVFGKRYCFNSNKGLQSSRWGATPSLGFDCNPFKPHG